MLENDAGGTFRLLKNRVSKTGNGERRMVSVRSPRGIEAVWASNVHLPYLDVPSLESPLYQLRHHPPYAGPVAVDV